MELLRGTMRRAPTLRKRGAAMEINGGSLAEVGARYRLISLAMEGNIFFPAPGAGFDNEFNAAVLAAAAGAANKPDREVVLRVAAREFTIHNGRLMHPSVMDEIAKAAQRQESARNAAQARWGNKPKKTTGR